MQTDILIVGQGICGTFLSHWLEQEGLSYIVIDEQRPSTASKAAAGIINPVTGRRIVKTWMIDELLPFAFDAYRQMNKELGISCLSLTETIEFFPTAQMRNAFMERYAAHPRITDPGKNTMNAKKADGTEFSGMPPDGAEYLDVPDTENAWNDWFRYDLGYGRISPCCLIDLNSLLTAARKKLKDRGQLLEERFDPAALHISGESAQDKLEQSALVRYKDIQANRIVFCDGAGSFESPYFRNLPFAPNKGEALIVEIGGLPSGSLIFKKGMVLAPWREGLYWLGSSYEWSFTDEQPTEAFRARAGAVLKEWLKLPFGVVDHIASVRPATLERRPFVGFLPLLKQVGILNGMGTKGCSLAPYFARQLAGHIKTGRPIQPDVDVKRFAKILGR